MAANAHKNPLRFALPSFSPIHKAKAVIRRQPSKTPTTRASVIMAKVSAPSALFLVRRYVAALG
jgi:hypothetical protein